MVNLPIFQKQIWTVVEFAETKCSARRRGCPSGPAAIYLLSDHQEIQLGKAHLRTSPEFLDRHAKTHGMFMYLL
uniref:GM10489p n=1 Tax=Drosophila melanogaster TaxID=7227 RepID=Q8T3J3_DROME